MRRTLEDNKEAGYTMTGRNSFSKEGIEKVTRFLYGNNTVLDVINVEDDPLYRKKDIDLIVLKKHLERDVKLSVEVKYDSYPERNLYFETVSNLTYNTPGCLTYSQAHFLYYLYEKTGTLYIIGMKEFQNWFKNNKEYLASKNCQKKVKNHDERNNGEYWSEGYAIPLSYIEKTLDKKYWAKRNLGVSEKKSVA